MMIRAYDKVYLDKARTALGRMLDFAVYELQFDMAEFWNLFIGSGVAARFGQGDFEVTVGRSGVELAYEVLMQSGLCSRRLKPQYPVERSQEYWTGWALAYYQWQTALTFADITRWVPIKDIRALYSPYHEMDIRQFCDKMNELYKAAKPGTNLKLLRQNAELSQRQLAERSGVPLRTIQQYEQRQRNINKAQAEHLLRLAQELSCDMQDLMELVE